MNYFFIYLYLLFVILDKPVCNKVKSKETCQNTYNSNAETYCSTYQCTYAGTPIF